MCETSFHASLISTSCNSVLRFGEIWTSIAASSTGVFAFGTSRGSLHIFDSCSGHFLIAIHNVHSTMPSSTTTYTSSNSSRYGCSILQIVFNAHVVVTAGEDGRICCIDWMSGRSEVVYAPSPSPSPSLNVSDSNDATSLRETMMHSSTVGYGSGVVIDIAISDDFSFNCGACFFTKSNSVIVKRIKNAIFGYHDLIIFEPPSCLPDVDTSSGSSAPLMRVTSLIAALPFLYFVYGSSVYVYNDRRSAIIGRLVAPVEHTNSCTYASGGFVNDVLVVLIDNYLVINWGTEVYFCARPQDDNTCSNDTSSSTHVLPVSTASAMTVLKRFQAGKNIETMTAFSRYIVMVFEDSDSTFEVALFSINSMSVVDSFPVPRSECPSDSLVGLISAVSSSSSTHPMPQVIIVYKHDVATIRPLLLAERVVALVSRREFIEALELLRHCGRIEEVREVSNLYASWLWSTCGEYARAMDIWGDSVLPNAGASFWRTFAMRVSAQGQLHLLEKFLPLDNAEKLSTDIYTSVIRNRLARSEPAAALGLILSWPCSVYDVVSVRQCFSGAVMQIAISCGCSDDFEGVLAICLNSMRKPLPHHIDITELRMDDDVVSTESYNTAPESLSTSLDFMTPSRVGNDEGVADNCFIRVREKSLSDLAHLLTALLKISEYTHDTVRTVLIVLLRHVLIQTGSISDPKANCVSPTAVSTSEALRLINKYNLWDALIGPGKRPPSIFADGLDDISEIESIQTTILVTLLHIDADGTIASLAACSCVVPPDHIKALLERFFSASDTGRCLAWNILAESDSSRIWKKMYVTATSNLQI